MDRTGHANLVRSIRVTPPVTEGTLYVEGIPKPPPGESEWPCVEIAGYVLRVALENKKTRIVIRKPWKAHTHEFDVVDLIRRAESIVGRPAWTMVDRTQRIHPTQATQVMTKAYGSELDRLRHWKPVPTLPFPVSPGGKETS